MPKKAISSSRCRQKCRVCSIWFIAKSTTLKSKGRGLHHARQTAASSIYLVCEQSYLKGTHCNVYNFPSWWRLWLQHALSCPIVPLIWCSHWIVDWSKKLGNNIRWCCLLRFQLNSPAQKQTSAWSITVSTSGRSRHGINLGSPISFLCPSVWREGLRIDEKYFCTKLHHFLVIICEGMPHIRIELFFHPVPAHIFLRSHQSILTSEKRKRN